MGQKTHSIGLRTGGLHRKWNDTWYAATHTYKSLFFAKQRVEETLRGFLHLYHYTKKAVTERTKRALLFNTKFIKTSNNLISIFAFFYKMRPRRRFYSLKKRKRHSFFKTLTIPTPANIGGKANWFKTVLTTIRRSKVTATKSKRKLVQKKAKDLTKSVVRVGRLRLKKSKIFSKTKSQSLLKDSKVKSIKKKAIKPNARKDKIVKILVNKTTSRTPLQQNWQVKNNKVRNSQAQSFKHASKTPAKQQLRDNKTQQPLANWDKFKLTGTTSPSNFKSNSNRSHYGKIHDKKDIYKKTRDSSFKKK